MGRRRPAPMRSSRRVLPAWSLPSTIPIRASAAAARILRHAGIEVTSGVLAEEALRANLGHILRVTRRRPMVTLKLAVTADGYAAGPAGDRVS